MKKGKIILAITTLALGGIAIFQTNHLLSTNKNNSITSQEIRSINIKDSGYAQSLIDKRLPEGNYRLILNNEKCSRCSKKMTNLLKQYPYKKAENIYVNVKDEETLSQIKKLFETTDVFDKKRALPFIIEFKIDNKNNINVQKYFVFD